jgi:hypothetical protein
MAETKKGGCRTCAPKKANVEVKESPKTTKKK